MDPGYSSRPGLLVLALLALCAPLALTDDSPEQKAALFAKCSDGQNCLADRTSWEHFTEDKPSCLTAARVWWSSRPIGIPVTLVTQLSAERLDQLRAQCATWNGPLAAALYLPLFNPTPDSLTEGNQHKLQATVASADALFRESESRKAPDAAAAVGPGSSSTTPSPAAGCQLRLVLIYELFSDLRALILYPVNSLRNYARLLADTDLITNIDVDMVPSLSISTALADAALRAEYAAGAAAGAVYVFPAFETHCGGTSYADAVALAPRFDLPQALRKCLRRMRPKAPFSHNATNYERWLSDAEGGPGAGGRAEQVYGITYEQLFEPWFLSWRWGTTWYDYRYRGYGKNKIVQAAAMNASGASWRVSPHGFLVHRPHGESRARKDFLRAKFSRKDMAALRGTVYEHVETLWSGTEGELAAGGYVARVEGAFERCRESLPWWQEPSGRGGGA